MDTGNHRPTVQHQHQTAMQIPAELRFNSNVDDLDRIENYLLDKQARQFKHWALALASHFAALKRVWSQKGKALYNNQAAIDAFFEAQYPTFARRLDRAHKELQEFARDLSPHAHRIYLLIFRRYLLEFYLESPLVRRAYEKPRGYPGDYLMMDQLYKQIPHGDTLFGRAMDRYILEQEEGSIMVRNRPQYLIAKICEAVERQRPDRVRVANIGCGTAEEIFVLLSTIPEFGQYLDVTLVDQDKEALAYCLDRLQPLAKATGATLEVVCEPVKRLFISDYASRFLHDNDMIYSAGLFDYFDTDVFQRLLQNLYGNLRIGGSLVVGNIDPTVPSRLLMEFAADWFVIYKTAFELKDMAYHLEPLPSQIVVEAEASGFNHFLVVNK